MLFLGCFVFLSACDDVNKIYGDATTKIESLGITQPEIQREFNEAYPFEINQCDFTYKRKALKFHTPISQWIEVLGPYTRNPEAMPNMYVWENMGITLRVKWKTDMVSSIEWFYRREPSNSIEYISNPENYIDGEKSAKAMVELENAWPKGRFSESIKLDGMLIDDQFDIDSLNEKRIERGLNPFHATMWRNDWANLRYCNGKELIFAFTRNENDPAKINTLSFTNLSDGI